MKAILISFVFLASFTDCQTKIENAHYISMGYDVYAGNPHFTETTSDPGVKNSRIFSLTFTKNKKTSDDKFILPDNISWLAMNSCNLSKSISTISGEKSYTDSLGIDASVDGGIEVASYGAKLSASTEFKKTSSETSKSKNSFIYVY